MKLSQIFETKKEVKDRNPVAKELRQNPQFKAKTEIDKKKEAKKGYQKHKGKMEEATIKPYSFAILRAVAGILQTHPKIKRLSIEGHTDDRGGKKYNLELSQKRAESVRQFIISEGVGEERLVAVGHGKEKPASKARGAEAREINRRVEFLILND